MKAALIDITQQCCDADEYLEMGYACAKAGMCYNPLRPLGDTLWFAIPYVFNTSENIFFYLHAILLAMVGISVFCLLRKILHTCLFLLVLIFLSWPTFFHALSDTPATLFFIEGIVLAFIGVNRNNPVIFFIAGIALGICVLLRAAYFYPLIVAITLFSIYWLLDKKRQWRAIFIISFVVPLSLQFFSTWKHSAQWNFLSAGRSHSMMNLHLNSDAAGYDTLLPQTGIYWSQNCAAPDGLLPSLMSMDISSAACIVKNRVSFYMGSYAASTYLGTGARNFFDNNTAFRIRRAEKNDRDYFIESKSLFPLPPGEYRYSIFLQAGNNQNQQVVNARIENLIISQAPASDSTAILKSMMANKSIIISNHSQQYTIDVRNNNAGFIVARISSPDDFNIRGFALEPTTSARGFLQSPEKITLKIGDSTTQIKNGRVFSSLYFLVNCLVVLYAAFHLFRLMLQTRSPIVIFISGLLFSVFMQCLIVIPEQRYIQGFLCACWLMCFMALSARKQKT